LKPNPEGNTLAGDPPIRQSARHTLGNKAAEITNSTMMRSTENLLQELMSLDESHRIEARRCAQIDRSVMENHPDQHHITVIDPT
jgi:hypothetical protein